MFCFSSSFKKLVPLEKYSPETDAEKIAINVVRKHGLQLAGIQDLIKFQYFKAGDDFAFQVGNSKTSGIEFRWIKGSQYFNEQGTLLIGHISDECFCHLLYIKDQSTRYSKEWQGQVLDEIYEEYLNA